VTPAPGLLISAARLLPATPGSAIAAGHVLVRGDKIVEVGQGRLPRPPDLALNSGLLAPGFVDLQINGYFGEDFAEADVAGWAKIARRLPETGTTAFLPTVITAPLDRLAASIAAAPGLFTGLPGARVLGLHVEGPFISPDRKGAHNSDWIINPTPSALTTLLAAGAGQIRIVTLAPERDGALDAIATLAGAGVLASVGHSDATAAQVAAAADAGARMVTHLFNAQSPLRHRAPGVPGQALTDHRLTSGLIADLEHVDAEVCAIAFAAAPGRICLVTDAAACAGMPPGEYILGGEPIELPPGDSVPPVRRDGTLAGSALRLDVAVANMVGAGADLAAAITAATRIPADLIGRPELGRIAPGAAADLVWLDDDLRTRATWVAGEMVYSTSSPPVLPQT
jgi:N-acetylglucosamine-6-phosphate deacetylase